MQLPVCRLPVTGKTHRVDAWKPETGNRQPDTEKSIAIFLKQH
jgi:hypothetical protein